MPEPQRLSALAQHILPAGHGDEADGVSLVELRPRAMAALLAAPAPEELLACLASHGLSGAPVPGRVVHGEHLRVLWSGPGQYLVVSEQHGEEALCHSLGTALQGRDSAVVDLSHARTVLRMAGPRVREVLAKGCPLDVDGMAPGDCAATVLSHFHILLHCSARAAFEIYVARSFGLACFQWLCHAGREFGMPVPGH